MIRWRDAMHTALYGANGFFTRPHAMPAAHFRTSAGASPLLAEALLQLLQRLDHALAHPDPLDVVDIGAGRGELLTALTDAAPPPLRRRLRPVAVELATPPADPGGIRWRRDVPAPVNGLLLATEWLDNVPVDVAEQDPDGTARYVLVDPTTGQESLGEPVTGADATWLDRWWPLSGPGSRAEIGRPRDKSWSAAVDAVQRGAALAIDYGHLSSDRPPFGTLTAFRDGRQVTPLPDGTCDLTAHVAMDAVAHPARPARLTRQREALHLLGVVGARPPIEDAHRDPQAYLRRLAAAGAAAELTDPHGLGGHFWLLQPVAVPALAWQDDRHEH